MENKTKQNVDFTAWECTESTVVHQNPWYRIRHDKVVREDGTMGDYFVVDKPQRSVYIVALHGDTILLVGQYRYPVNHYSWEIPAGGGSEQLTSLESAQKELAEEAGYDAAHWQEIGLFDHLNGYGNEQDYVYLATGLTPTVQKVHQDDSEFLKRREVSWDEVWNMIYRGEIVCAGTITSLTLARPHIEPLLKHNE